MKRLIALMLVLLMVLPFAACAADDGGDVANTTTSSGGNTTTTDSGGVTTTAGGSSDGTGDATTAEVTTQRSETVDNLPADLKFDNKKVTIFYRPGSQLEDYDVLGTDNFGDTVTDEVYKRNARIETRLEIEFDFIPIPGEGLGGIRNTVKTTLGSGVSNYDIILTTGNSIIQAEVNGYMKDLSTADYIDYDQPWWWNDAIEEVSPDGETYNYLIGSMLLSNYLKLGVVYCNKGMYNEFFPESNANELYTTVANGDWTIDYFAEACEKAYVDENGLGDYDDDDTYGFAYSATLLETDVHFLFGCDVELYTRNEDKTITINMTEDHTLKVIDKCNALYKKNIGAHSYISTGIDALSAKFAEEKILFLPGRLTAVLQPELRSMPDDSYAILPFPKYDTAQENYISLIHSSSNVIGIASVISDDRMPMLSAVLEALASDSYRNVVTYFLDAALKVKYSKDALSGQVIDLVIEGATKNFIFEYSPQSDNIITYPVLAFSGTGSGSFTTLYSRFIDAAQNKLDEFIISINQSKQ